MPLRTLAWKRIVKYPYQYALGIIGLAVSDIQVMTTVLGWKDRASLDTVLLSAIALGVVLMLISSLRQQEQRKEELRILSTLGFNRRALSQLVLWEAVWLFVPAMLLGYSIVLIGSNRIYWNIFMAFGIAGIQMSLFFLLIRRTILQKIFSSWDQR